MKKKQPLRCRGKNKAGRRCRRIPAENEVFCYLHVADREPAWKLGPWSRESAIEKITRHRPEFAAPIGATRGPLIALVHRDRFLEARRYMQFHDAAWLEAFDRGEISAEPLRPVPVTPIVLPKPAPKLPAIVKPKPIATPIEPPKPAPDPFEKFPPAIAKRMRELNAWALTRADFHDGLCAEGLPIVPWAPVDDEDTLIKKRAARQMAGLARATTFDR